MPHTVALAMWFAVALLMLVDAVAYSFGAIGPICRALSPGDPYWRRRLLLNLMLANQGLYLGAAIALAGAALAIRSPESTSVFLALTLATCIYTLVTVPVLTPRDSWHVVPRALAAVLIIIGFILA